MVWLILSLVLLIPLVSIFLDSQLGKALAGRVEARSITGGDTVTQERLAFLESEVDRLGRELAQVSEESHFVQQLLADRDDASERALPAGEDGEGTAPSSDDSDRTRSSGGGDS